MRDIGRVVKEEREAAGLTQEAVAKRVPCNRSLISRIESGETAASPEMLRRLAQVIGSERLYREAALMMSAAFVSPALDGQVDLHRTNVLAVWREEMREALEAVESAKSAITRAPEGVSEQDRGRIREAALQVIDLEAACEHLVAALARTYALDLVGLYKEHHDKLRARGYTRSRRQAAQAAEVA